MGMETMFQQMIILLLIMLVLLAFMLVVLAAKIILSDVHIKIPFIESLKNKSNIRKMEETKIDEEIISEGNKAIKQNIAEADRFSFDKREKIEDVDLNE